MSYHTRFWRLWFYCLDCLFSRPSILIYVEVIWSIICIFPSQLLILTLCLITGTCSWTCQKMLLCKFELLVLSDKAGCQTKNLFVWFVDLTVDPQACNALSPSTSSRVEQCSLCWLPLYQALNGHMHCAGSLFICSDTFSAKLWANITLHLSVCSMQILSCPAPAGPELAESTGSRSTSLAASLGETH